MEFCNNIDDGLVECMYAVLVGGFRLLIREEDCWQTT